MRIFISYASEQFDTAKRLNLGLLNSGNDVFFDRDDLPAGAFYDDRIRTAVQNSHLFIFLISKDSIRKGAYALSELSMAEKRWSQPSGKILPVLFDDTPIDTLPPYLRAVSVLVPTGDLVAEVLDSVARLSGDRRRVLSRRAAVVALLLLVVAGLPFAWKLKKHPAPNPPNANTVQPAPAVPIADAKKPEEVASNVTVRSVLAGPSNQPGQFVFDIVVDNERDEKITAIDLGPFTDNPKVRLGSSNEWFEVHPTEKKRTTIKADLHNEANATSFQWRVCLGYVTSLDLAMAPKDIDLDLFLPRYRKEVCEPWRDWPTKP
jgi:hypothetical protein